MTAHIRLEHYLHYEAKTEPNLTWAVFANVNSEQMSLKSGDSFNVATPTNHLRDDLILLSRKKVQVHTYNPIMGFL